MKIMRRVPLPARLFLALLISYPGVAGAVPPPSPDSITAVYWNIQWFPGRRPNASRTSEAKQIAAVHREMGRLHPDFIGLEEVRDFAKAKLAVEPLPGFHVDVCSNFPPREDQEVGQQVAIASRLRPLSAWAEQWKPGRDVTPPRGFAFAAYQIGPGRLLLAYAVHLKSNHGGLRENMVIREESIRQLLAHMRAMQSAYGKLGRLTWIVGGDFNTAPDDKRFALERTVPSLEAAGFAWSWQDIPFRSRVTLPATRRFPDACFDQIFYRNLVLRSARVIKTSRAASDHRALAAVFEM
jgi:endonuclease/exonuclease/phosphatase family metal-dependent hydrolase